MKSSIQTSVAVVCLAVAFWTAPCRAADTRPLVDAVLRFVDALDAGDAEALRESIWVTENTESQRLGRDAWVSLAMAQKRLERAAAARFGAEGERFRRGMDLFLPAVDRGSLASLTVLPDDGKGPRMIREGESWYLRLRRSPQGQLQVVLDLIEVELDDDPVRGVADAPSQFRIDRLVAMAEAFSKTADRISQGDFPTAAAADAELVDRVVAIDKDFRQKIRSLPERYRWFQGPW